MKIIVTPALAPGASVARAFAGSDPLIVRRLLTCTALLAQHGAVQASSHRTLLATTYN